MDKILEVKNLMFSYAAAPDMPALRGVSFTAMRGDFITVCGSTGSGKSTLLRCLKPELFPAGYMSGNVLYYPDGSAGCEISSLDLRISASKIGFVMQRPEQQIVTDKVWHELAFGLENLGIESERIHRRVAEMASYFGIEKWFDYRTDELSGGQKQLLNLAAVMVMDPELLILDEPTAQLDPVAAVDFLETLGRLSRDMGVTVILVEHRLEQAIPLSNKLLALDDGKVLAFDAPARAIRCLSSHPGLLMSMPAAVRIYNELCADFPASRSDTDEVCPISVREGAAWIKDSFSNRISSISHIPYILSKTPVLEMENVFFRYGISLPDVLRGTSLTVYEGEIFCILGGNGSGKSTTLKCCSGLIKPQHGTVRVLGKKIKDYSGQSLYDGCLSLLPQDVQTVFMHKTVREELSAIDENLLPYDLSKYLDRHPYDLSGGQQQLLALAKVLATRPKVLLLDEPTKGIDAPSRSQLMNVLRSLRDNGMTIVMVTHDVDFAAEISDRCALFFRGEVTGLGEPWVFFRENNFYTTAVNRMTRDYYDGCVTVNDVVKICRENHVSGNDDGNSFGDNCGGSDDGSAGEVSDSIAAGTNLPGVYTAKKHVARRIVIIAVMTALSVLGRFIFAWVPAFKPVTAIVIITGIWMGAPDGLAVGLLSAFISNFYFGQGPWTPFQMLAWGLIGLVAGLLATPLKKSRLLLSVYGAVTGAFFSLLMDVFTVTWYQGSFSWPMYLTSLAASLPFILAYAVSNVVFLLVLGRPFGEKLQRIKKNYGI